MSADIETFSAHTDVELQGLAATATEFATSSRAASTLRAYRSDWNDFARWCTDHGVDPLPAAPATVALYLADLAGVRAVATIARRLTSISQAHAEAGHTSPTKTEPVRQVWSGIRRTFGTASTGKSPLVTDDIRAMVAHLGDRPIDIRDRALVLIGFAGALRRAELVALNVDDITETDDGLLVVIKRSKTDQEGAGHTLGLPFGSDPSTCPVRVYRRHLEATGITDGPVFRSTRTGARLSGRSAATRVKRLAALIGRDVTTIGAHSLRAGLITSAARNGAHERDIMRHSRHRSIHVFRSYIRDVGLFDTNAAASVGL